MARTMKFGPVPVEECAGAILAHGLSVATGAFKKGRVLSAEDADALRQAGYESVVVARLDPGDVDENTAAAALAKALAGDGAGAARAFTGRCNLFARQEGLLLLDGQRVGAMNAVDEAMAAIREALGDSES